MKDKSGNGSTADTIKSLTLNPHISYLYPTNKEIVKEPAFIALQLGLHGSASDLERSLVPCFNLSLLAR